MNDTLQNRREFLRNAARLALLGGVGALGYRLFHRASLDACLNNEICLNCRRVSDCEWPAAQRNRQQREGTGGTHG